MKKMSIYSQNLAYKFGGAEKCLFSLYNLLRNSFDISLISGDDTRLRNYDRHAYESVDFIRVIHIDNLGYTKLVLNAVITFFSVNLNCSDVTISNCSSGVGVALKSLFLKKKTVFYVHEEYSLNNYSSYIKPITFNAKFLRCLKNCVDYPFFLIYCGLNRIVMKKSDVVIANSRFIQEQIFHKFNRQSELVYPFTKTINNPIYDYNSQGYITMVGDGYVKGIETFKALAKLMPNKKFRIVAKSSNPIKQDNLVVCPFFKDIEEMYKTTSIMLVPSIWKEAFGKVSIEASSRGIPVFVSNSGALAETVCSSYYVVEDYLDAHSWKSKITDFEKNLSTFDSSLLVEYSAQFDENKDAIKLQNIVSGLFENA
jgi:glycosyltransferase involved in cell wall biosynthesis